MWFFPLGAAIVSALFAALVGQQFLSKAKPQQLAWAIALLMFSIACFAAAMGILGGWTPFLYRAFFLFGAITNVPVLALGTLYLLGPKRLGDVAAGIVTIASIVAVGAVFFSPLKVPGALNVVGRIPRSSLVLSNSTLLLARYMSFGGFFIVVGGALLSAWRLSRKREEQLRRIAMANILIAVGTSVVAGASGFLAIGNQLGSALFSVGLLAGVTMMFMGFLKTRPRTKEQAVQPDTPPA